MFIKCEGTVGRSIEEAIAQAIALCTVSISVQPDALFRFEYEDDGSSETTVCFEFNGVFVTMKADSTFELIFRDWRRAMEGCIDKHVGPYPSQFLTHEEKNRDERIEAENRRRREEEYARRRAEEQAERDTLMEKLADAPPMEVNDDIPWTEVEHLTDFAEAWTRLMQLEIARGYELEEIAASTSHEAAVLGVTGSTYAVAIATLARCWKHGERLRRWHNATSQLHNEGDHANESGGVLDPAILCIEV